MNIARSFQVSLYGELVGVVHFVGPEYDAAKVKEFLIQNERMDKDIIVKLVKENKIK